MNIVIVVRLVSEAKAEVEAEKVIGVNSKRCQTSNTDKRSWHQRVKE
jgi:hypothetical protein